MPIEYDRLVEVMKRCEPLVKIADSLHLTSIAKALEQEQGCQIFISGCEEEARIAEVDCFTGHCEPFLILRPREDSQKPAFVFVQHFIFYKRHEDSEVERWRVAHELGHCALHWPLKERESRRVSGSLAGIGKFYLVQYTLEEEAEADAFACLISAHRPAPQRPPVTVDQRVFDRVKEYTERGILQSRITPS